jgi:hypothetical protein
MKTKRSPSIPGRFFQPSISPRLSGLSSGKLPRIARRSGCWRAASTASSLEFGSQDAGGSHAGFVHLFQQIVLGEGGDLTVIGVRGLAAAPDVDLRIDDQHGVLLIRVGFGRRIISGPGPD